MDDESSRRGSSASNAKRAAPRLRRGAPFPKILETTGETARPKASSFNSAFMDPPGPDWQNLTIWKFKKEKNPEMAPPFRYRCQSGFIRAVVAIAIRKSDGPDKL